MSDTTPQPLDALMTKHGISNADLVSASTEQLTFKMVQKGRRGRRLTPNVQEKILNAFRAARPELSVRRRDLFRYEMNPVAVETVRESLRLLSKGEITYPHFIDLLAAAGVTGYTADVASDRLTFYGMAGEAMTEELPPARVPALGVYDEAALKKAIADAGKRSIDHPEFLRRIHAAGISSYDVNIRKMRIDYLGEKGSFRESIPAYVPQAEAPKPAAEAAPKKKAPKKAESKKKRPGVIRTTRKQRLTYRRKLRAAKKKKRR